MGIADKAAKTETFLALAGRVWAFAKEFGVVNQAIAAAWLLILASWGWAMTYLQSLPVWAWLLTGAIFATYSVKLWNAIKVARSLRGVKTLDIQQFGADCLTYYRDYAAIMANRGTPNRFAEGHSAEEMHRQWQRGVELSERTAALVMERFGPRAYALVQQMSALGIPRPSTFHFSHGGDGAVSLYIGLVGEMLNKGLLDEARKLDPNVTWGAGFR